MNKLKVYGFGLIIGLVLALQSVAAQTNEFTYQGRLLDNSLPPTASYDFEFSLWDALANGTQQGATLTFDGAGGNPPSVQVTNGIFTVRLNFGAQFSGAARFLQIAVRPAGGGAYTTLAPRQPITSSPYSIKSATSTSADGLSIVCNLCVTDAHIQSLAGNKLTGVITGNGSGITNINGGNITTGSVTSSQLSAEALPNSTALKLLGSRRWDLLKPQSTFAVGTSPLAVEYDGANIWVANNNINNVTKLRASDGACAGVIGPPTPACTFAVGTGPVGVAFDGANIWVTNVNSANVTRLRASDGACAGVIGPPTPACTFAVGTNPQGVAFDGANIWVANFSNNNVTRLRASDGANLGTFAVGSGPRGVAFDGANIWVVNSSSNNVTKLRASDGACAGVIGPPTPACTFAVGTQPFGVAFDGANIWVANFGSANVTRLRASDGFNLGTVAVGSGPIEVAFDGANIWVANNGSGSVTKLRSSDGANLGNFPVGTNPRGVAFDGANIWVANTSGNNVTRLMPAFPQP